MPLGPRGQSSFDAQPEPPREAPHAVPFSPPAGASPLHPSAPRAPRPRAGERLRVQAIGLDDGGAGRCPVGGLTLHVPGILPGEFGNVLISHVSPHQPHGWAKLQQRLSDSPERQVPICAGYGVCGGCSLQHMSYAAQLRWKQEQLTAALAPLSRPPGVADVATRVRDCVGSPGHAGDGSVPEYRSRVKLIATTQPSVPGLMLGSYVPRSHAVVPMTGCRVHSRTLTATIAKLTSVLNRLGLRPYNEERAQGTLRYVLLRETAGGEQQLSLVVAEPPTEAVLTALTTTLRQVCPELASIVLHQNRSRGNALLSEDDSRSDSAEEDRVLHGLPYVWEDIGGVPLRVSARSFLQVNRATATRIYADVATELAAALATDTPMTAPRILDVYCGVGGLGLTLLSRIPGSTLLGLEWGESAIADARASAERLGVSPRVEFYAGPAESRLTEPELRGRLGDLAVTLLNPPRRGCSEPVLSAVLALRPAHIAYVSCSPESLARDLGVLCAAGYRLRHSTPYDMHPGTPHIESATYLVDTRRPVPPAT